MDLLLGFGVFWGVLLSVAFLLSKMVKVERSPERPGYLRFSIHIWPPFWRKP